MLKLDRFPTYEQTLMYLYL